MATASFPSEEKFGLVSQLRRAAISVPSNIAEGAARKSKKGFIQFLYVGEGSVSELDTLIQLACELNFFSKQTTDNLLTLLEDISKRIIDLIKKLESEF